MLIFRIKKVNDSFQALPKIFIRKEKETNYRELFVKKDEAFNICEGINTFEIKTELLPSGEHHATFTLDINLDDKSQDLICEIINNPEIDKIYVEFNKKKFTLNWN